MKVVVSIPDDVYERAEHFARRTGISRNRLFSDALSEYFGRHTSGEITAAMDKSYAELGEAGNSWASSAARRALQRSEW